VATPPLPPIDLAPAKVYLPPPPKIPLPSASVSPPTIEPVSSASAPAELDGPAQDTAPAAAPLSTPDLWARGESPEEFLSRQATQWTPGPAIPEALPSVPEPDEKKSRLFKRTKKPKVKMSNGFEYVVPSRGTGKGPAEVTVGPAPAARREINCPRCGQPSPRGLCEVCEDALSQLRQLTEAFLDE